MRIASEKGLDLVEVAPTAKPPVCRVMDYGKYKYEQAKRNREARKKQKTSDVKEVKIRPSIDEHDLDVKIKNAQRFLQDGDKIKVTVVFRGREIAHADIGKNLLNRFSEQLQQYGVVEKPARIEGRNMIMIMAPKAN